jgi:hypothetical protein
VARWRKRPGVRPPEWLLSPYADQAAVWAWMDALQERDRAAWDELFEAVLSVPVYDAPAWPAGG